MTATQPHSTLDPHGLYLAFELGNSKWILALATPGQPTRRQRTIQARDLAALEAEIKLAKVRLGLPEDAKVYACYEAGRDGFWLHRALERRGVKNLVVDSASIEVSRRQRRAKTDRLDAAKLLQMLLRHHGGEARVWSVVRVPTPEQEQRRQNHRELRALLKERTALTNQIAGLLAGVGVVCAALNQQAVAGLGQQRTPEGQAIPSRLLERIARVWERVEVLDGQIAALRAQRRQETVSGRAQDLAKVRGLLSLKAIGMVGAHTLVRECFGWRQFANRREVGGFFGLAPCPYASGDMQRETGVGGTGAPELRALTIELAWGWVRLQPDSALTKWFQQRFGGGGKRHRRIGIVALARRLMIALWRYLEQGVVPEGARLTPWWRKLGLDQEPAACAGP